MPIPPLVPYRITVCGLAELCAHAAARVTHVLTILDPDFPDPEDFAGFAPHRRTVWRFHDTIREGQGLSPPSTADVEAILAFGRDMRDDKDISHLLVHCHMGISRSTATAAILMAQHHPGREDEAFAALRAIRPKSWPNSRMIAQADQLLGRQGRLLAAMRDHHRAVAGAHPDLAAELLKGERAEEVPLT